MNFLTSAYHPKDVQYRVKRRNIIDKELRGMSHGQIDESFLFAASQPAPEGTKEMSRRIMTDLVSSFPEGRMPEKLKSILDTTGGGTSGGSVLIRQDLEPSAR